MKNTYSLDNVKFGDLFTNGEQTLKVIHADAGAVMFDNGYCPTWSVLNDCSLNDWRKVEEPADETTEEPADEQLELFPPHPPKLESIPQLIRYAYAEETSTGFQTIAFSDVLGTRKYYAYKGEFRHRNQAQSLADKVSSAGIIDLTEWRRLDY